MKESKSKQKNINIIGTIILIILLIGATYAYFILSNGDDAQGGVHITSNTTDSLMFEIERGISLTLDTENFLKDSGNQSDRVWAKAELLPNNKTNEAHDLYNMYFVITDNEFDYVTENKKAEILLKVIDTKGTEVTTDDEVIDDDVEGLNYVTITDGKSISHSGYDITKAYGLYKIINEKGIDANGGSEVHKYNIEVVFINYNENQSENAGKDLDATILLSKEDYEEYEPTFVNAMNVAKSSSSITTSLNITEGSSEIDKYYFKAEKVVESPTAYVESKNKVVKLAQGNSNDVFVERSNANYTFDAVANKKYNVYAYTVDKAGIKSNIYKQVIVNDDKVLPVIDNVVSEITGDIKITITTSSSNISSYCYSINKGKYECTNSNIYTFNDINSLYGNIVSVYIIDENNNKSLEYKVRTEKLDTLVTHIKKLYENQTYEGENGLYLHDGEGTYNNYNYGQYESGAGLDENATYDNSYRYAGSNSIVNNYVCFGGTCDESGTSENLYRIIGVFDGQVKLIKATYAKSALLGSDCHSSNDNYYWTLVSDNNTVEDSILFTKTLNENYLNNIGTWASYISEHTWKVGGNLYDNIAIETNAKKVYNYELVNMNTLYSSNNKAEYINKIGLMYVSDYMYAASPLANSNIWSMINVYSYGQVKTSNWLLTNQIEWLMTRCSTYANSRYYVYGIGTNGNISNTTNANEFCPYADVRKVRPVFYLDANILYISGSGTSTDPFIIKK